MSRRKQAKPIRHLDDGSTDGANGELAAELPGSALFSGESDHLDSSDANADGTDLDHSGGEGSSVAGAVSGGANSEDAGSDPGGRAQPSLFIKRSVDEDFANNNNRRTAPIADDEDNADDAADGEAESKLRRRHESGSDPEDEAMDTDDGHAAKMDFPSLLGGLGGSAATNPFLAFTQQHQNSSDSSVTDQLKEQLKAISMTISQLTSSITSNSSPKSVQELTVLQATLFSLQQQQILQMQILSQMQQSEKSGSSALKDERPSMADLAKKMERQNTLVAASRPRLPPPSTSESRGSALGSTPLPPSMPSKQTLLTGSGLAPPTSEATRSLHQSDAQVTSASLSSQILDPNSPTSLASSIIMHTDSPDERPVNSLELLQKRAQGILNNASQGLLANNLADFSINKDKDFDKKEPFFKHRCRYCGKVFGSDSALQIHVRSHTGERPYKCNICGNRFTTKGNLKVHFQRHSAKFPHVKMNPNLVPEHLDKFYPPLLQQIEEAEKKGLPLPNVNNPMAGMTPVIPPGFNLANLPGPLPGSSLPSPGQHLVPGIPRFPIPTSLSGPLASLTSRFNLPPLPTEPIRRDDMPQNLSKATPRSRSVSPIPDHAMFLAIRREVEARERERELRERERERERELDIERDRSRSRSREGIDHADDESGMEEMDDDRRSASISRPSPDEDVDEEDKRSFRSGGDDSLHHGHPGVDAQEEPENLTKRSASPPPHHLSSLFGRKSPPPLHDDRSNSPKRFLPFPFGGSGGGAISPLIASTPNGPLLLPHNIDPAKDPNLYTNLLPRPGSNDNAWESLIEVSKTSETTKLEQLVNNIEHKLSDPNECVICHRVLSCKSALQMHYRTHTGERPFKCRICGRAFTTKGNLKTHMGVHRAKPPMRMFHQCPVCHKKYANALVLQQHIRTHTGEPTELTPEQIAAAEIKDFPQLPFPPGGPFGPFGGSLRLQGSGLFPGLPLPPGVGFGSESQSPEALDKDDRDSGEDTRPSSGSSANSSTKNLGLSFSSPSSAAALASLSEAYLAKSGDSRPYGLVRPFLFDKPMGGLPEDLSPPARKLSPSEKERDSSPHSPLSPAMRKSSPERDSSLSPRRFDDLPKQNGDLISSMGLKSPLALDLTPRSNGSGPLGSHGHGHSQPALPPPPPPPLSLFSGFSGLLPPSPAFANPFLSAGSPSALSQLSAASAALANSPFNPLGLPFPGAPMAFRPRGNTTCSICFKVFACHSALEIHMRSHTKERPFKCTICDRGFSTKGNMKQHVLTHKTRDDGATSDSGNGVNVPTSRSSSPGDNSNSQADSLKSSIKDEVSSDGGGNGGLKALLMEDSPPVAASVSASIKRPPSEMDSLSPQPKRSHGFSTKHLCHVCKKGFSSGSALEIHGRTHTGERPFKCSVCAKAFTTKGNLKVHMGIHMWSSPQVSRRGRRMSLDLPHPPIPMTSKDSEFLQRRPDLAAFPFPPTQLSFGPDAAKHQASLFASPLNGSLEDGFARTSRGLLSPAGSVGQPLRATLDHLPSFRPAPHSPERSPAEMDDCVPAEDEDEDEPLLKTASPSSSPSLASGAMEEARLRGCEARAGESLVV